MRISENRFSSGGSPLIEECSSNECASLSERFLHLIYSRHLTREEAQTSHDWLSTIQERLSEEVMTGISLESLEHLFPGSTQIANDP